MKRAELCRPPRISTGDGATHFYMTRLVFYEYLEECSTTVSKSIRETKFFISSCDNINKRKQNSIRDYY